MQVERDQRAAQLPAEADDFLGRCLTQPQETLLALLAYAAAMSVNAVRVKHDREEAPRRAHARALAAARGRAKGQWWQPSIEGFYGKLSKATLLHIVTEAKAPMVISISQVKKPDAARYVAQAMTGQAWLPAPLRAA